MAEDLAACTGDVDAESVSFNLLVAFNWARRGLPPLDLYDMRYGDAVTVLHCYDILFVAPDDDEDKEKDA